MDGKHVKDQMEQLKAGLIAQIDSVRDSIEVEEETEVEKIGEAPGVTCLCPTYGRFTHLRTAIACFLLQTYKPRTLLIVNDGPYPLKLTWAGKKRLRGDGWEIVLRNMPEYETLGQKRQEMAESAETPLVAHWDDDDLYFPWHLAELVKAQTESGAAVVAQWPSFDGEVSGKKLHMTPCCWKPHDGGWLFVRQWLLESGGYAHTDWGESVSVGKRAKKEGLFFGYNSQFCGQGISYARTRGNGMALNLWGRSTQKSGRSGIGNVPKNEYV